MENSEYLDLVALFGDTPDLHIQSAVENIGGSVALYEQVLKKVTGLLPSNIAVMDQALVTNDLNAFGIKAHGMKGSFNQVGCLRLAGLAEALEVAAKDGDAVYCDTHYDSFKKEVFAFHDQMSLILCNKETNAEAEDENAAEGHITDFADALEQARQAASGFDCLAAVKSFIPLTRRHFGRDIDLLVCQAMEELEAFRPRKAVPYIAALLNECEGQERGKGGQADGE